ncbi:hypothetical protein PIB30_032703 [Stylosanthes scabra]|uniref:Uncharacterized protein n=1 Tax=Stylosanthes scabra TaxID=79078 RepID=A0ABU6RD51_9FABA|nr:hypothetical protein [Stylosanthes scabra]
MSKPQLSSHIKIQIQRSSSTKIQEAATIPNSKIQKTNREQRDAISDSQRQHEADSSEIQHSQINRVQLQSLIRNSNYNSSHPEIHLTFQGPEITVSRIHNIQEAALNAEFQANTVGAPYLDVPVRATVDDKTTPLISGVEVEEKRVDQPPPKPPDLKSHMVVLCNVDGVETEDNGQDLQPLRDVDEAGTSAEVGASERGKWTGAVATATDGRLWAQWLRRFVSLTPPPLLAIVFPWNPGGAEQRLAGRSSSLLCFGNGEKLADVFTSAATTACKTPFAVTKVPWGYGGDTETVKESVGFRVDGRNGGHGGAWLDGGCPLVVGTEECERLGFMEASVRSLFCLRSVNAKNEGNVLTPLHCLGLLDLPLHQHQIEDFGLNFTKYYFEYLVGQFFFKQWDPGGRFLFLQ